MRLLFLTFYAVLLTAVLIRAIPVPIDDEDNDEADFDLSTEDKDVGLMKTNPQLELMREKLKKLKIANAARARQEVRDVPLQAMPRRPSYRNITRSVFASVEKINERIDEYLYQSDILLTEEQVDDLLSADENDDDSDSSSSEATPDETSLHRRIKRKVISDRKRKWSTKQPISYYISADLTPAKKQVIASALNFWQHHTCLTFEEVEVLKNNKDVIHFINDDGCYSKLGRIGGIQELSVGDGCEHLGFGIVSHEVGHALGFWHEQMRSDRDNFIQVHLKNVQFGKEGNFAKQTANSIKMYNIPYEYGSIMHYAADDFTRDKNLNVLVATNELYQQTMGQRTAPSFFDVHQANRHYECLEWKDGSKVALGVREDPRNVGGIGFIVSKEWSKSIDSLDVLRPRIGVLTINLQKQQTLCIIQVYAPTSAADDEEIERFYDDLEEEINKRSTYLVVMGDFNAKVGRRQDDETFIGPFGGDRNKRGKRLAAMAESRRLFVANTFFQKRAGRRWTWISPNGETKNEIDYILTNRLQIVQDVTAIGRAFSTGSDHRLIRARIVLDAKVEKKALAISNAGQKKMTFDAKVFLQHVDASDWTLNEDLNDDYNKFVDQLRHCRQQSEVPCDNHQQKRISSSTRALLDQRRQTKWITANNVEYHLLCKLICHQLKEDHDAFRRQALLDTAEKHRSLRKCQRNLVQQRVQMSSLTTSTGLKTKTRTGMEQECTAFYTSLFKSKVPIDSPLICRSTPTSIPDVLNSEVRYALQQAENDKAPGKDRIEIEMLKAGGPTLWQAIASHFSQEFDEQQPKEQAGFHSGYSTIDHIQVLNQLIERYREYKTPLVLAFVDYEKAFDSVEFNAVLQALHRQGFDNDYIALLQELNNDCMTDITLFYKPLRIPIGRGVRQGDTISPKLFTACLEDVFRQMELTGGLNIDGQKLTHLRFADDIVLIGDSTADVQKLLNDLDRNSKAVGLRMNRAKTKWMRNQHADADSIKVDDDALEEVSSYVYLGQELTMNHDISRELARRCEISMQMQIQSRLMMMPLKKSPAMSTSARN
uniref:Metalloendopeptidase n=1 Tax=Plectus sambesii TaxID=2011161 RepID=A0A914W5Q0_9BILA